MSELDDISPINRIAADTDSFYTPSASRGRRAGDERTASAIGPTHRERRRRLHVGGGPQPAEDPTDERPIDQVTVAEALAFRNVLSEEP